MMRNRHGDHHPDIRDYGCEPFVFPLDHAAGNNPNFRTTLWTGKHLQLTLMSIPVGGDIGAEMHADTDQFIGVESGRAKVYFGPCPNALQEQAYVESGYAILVPAGTWHNIVNVGRQPLKLYSLYAPPHHPRGTVHKTRADAQSPGGYSL